MSDYFAKAAARADPAPAPHRAPAPPAPLDEPVVGFDEVVFPAPPEPGGALPPGSFPERTDPPAPDPWPTSSFAVQLVPDVVAEPITGSPPGTVAPPRDDHDGRPDPAAEPGSPSRPTFVPRPADAEEPARPAPVKVDRPVPLPLEHVRIDPWPEQASPEEVPVPAARPPAPPVPDDPLALADAVMLESIEPPQAVVPPPEASPPDVSAAEPGHGPAVVIDRLTVELVDDRPARAAEPAPRPRPRPTGHLAGGRRFDSGWGW